MLICFLTSSHRRLIYWETRSKVKIMRLVFKSSRLIFIMLFFFIFGFFVGGYVFILKSDSTAFPAYRRPGLRARDRLGFRCTSTEDCLLPTFLSFNSDLSPYFVVKKIRDDSCLAPFVFFAVIIIKVQTFAFY